MTAGRRRGQRRQRGLSQAAAAGAAGGNGCSCRNPPLVCIIINACGGYHSAPNRSFSVGVPSCPVGCAGRRATTCRCAASGATLHHSSPAARHQQPTRSVGRAQGPPSGLSGWLTPAATASLPCRSPATLRPPAAPTAPTMSGERRRRAERWSGGGGGQAGARCCSCKHWRGSALGPPKPHVPSSCLSTHPPLPRHRPQRRVPAGRARRRPDRAQVRPVADRARGGAGGAGDTGGGEGAREGVRRGGKQQRRACRYADCPESTYVQGTPPALSLPPSRSAALPTPQGGAAVKAQLAEGDRQAEKLEAARVSPEGRASEGGGLAGSAQAAAP